MIKIPNCYQKLNALPDDPPKAEIFGFATKHFQSLLKVFPVSKEQAMPLDVNKIVNGIHQCLSEDQGLIECQKGKTKSGLSYIYSIIKNRLQPSGVQYFLRLHLIDFDSIKEVNIFTDEIGTTGMRDASVYAMLKIKDQSEWFCDPFDKDYKKGLLMNLSEKIEYDSIFRDHPLSENRSLKDFIIKNN